MSYFEIIARKFRTALALKNEHGWRGLKNRLDRRRREFREQQSYRKWVDRRRLTDADRRALRRRIEDLPRRPLLSIVLPVYNVEEKWLRACLESVFRQLYENWELCIADDNSPAPHIEKVLHEFAARDPRVKVVFRDANGHISAASNSALALATGEFCVLLDHDDELAEDALFYVAAELNDFPETAFIYSDEDLIDERGRRFKPKFKPDFSRDLFYGLNLITHLSAYRTALLREIGGFRVGLEGSQDYDLALRVVERIDDAQIRHIPRILYHWRTVSGSVALSADEKPYAHERARQALREHFARIGKAARVERGIYQFHRVRYELPDKPPKISLILSGGAAVANAAFLSEIAYPELEISVLPPDDSPTAARLNRAAAASTGEILCFLDAALRPLSKDWLTELAGFALQTEIGAVGGKILAADETVAGGGLIVGFDGLVGAAHRGLPREADGNLYRARIVNNFSAVSIACLMVRRAVFDELGGFDAANLPGALFDADFCLRLGARGRRVVFTPDAEFRRTVKNAGEQSPTAAEHDFFKQKWRTAIESDPFYNPNFSRRGETFTLKD